LKKKNCFVFICIILLFVNISNAEAGKSGWGKNDRFKWIITEIEEYDYHRWGSSSWNNWEEEVSKEMKIKVLDLNNEISEYTYSFNTNIDTYYKSRSTPATTNSEKQSGYGRKNCSGNYLFEYYKDFNDFIFLDYDLKEGGFYLDTFSFNIDLLVKHFSYLIKTDWQVFNQKLKTFFDPNLVIYDLYFGPLTLEEFLEDISFSIMGKNNLTEALEEFGPDTRRWTFEFDLSNELLLPDDPNLFFCDKAIENLVLAYSVDGVLEELVYESNYDFNDFYYITKSNTKKIEIIRKPTLGPFSKAATIGASLIVTIEVLVFGIKSKPKSVVIKSKTKSIENDLIQTPTEITQENCSICKLEIRENQRLRQCMLCYAIFHEEHLEKWMQKNNDCPVCDRRIKKAN